MNLLGMFARRPEPGKTKTRLAKSIGNAAAAAVYAAFVEDLIDRCETLADQFVVAATPNDDLTATWFRSRTADSTSVEFQPDGDLGKRIEWFFQQAFEKQFGKVVLIGSDSPDLPPAIISRAFRELGHFDVVLSPATDGGYVLVGLRSFSPGMFAHVNWSAATTLLDTVRAAKEAKLSVTLLPLWYDIDLIENLGTLIALQSQTGSEAADCPATMEAINGRWSTIEPALK
ncbi:MAG TPA: glycosyltransferase [Planctomycetes bacterium]|nr:glycosyltransferase [Planctomycetota bacterium]